MWHQPLPKTHGVSTHPSPLTETDQRSNRLGHDLLELARIDRRVETCRSWCCQKLGMRTSELPGGCFPVFVRRYSGDLRFLGCCWRFIVWSTLDVSWIHKIHEKNGRQLDEPRDLMAPFRWFGMWQACKLVSRSFYCGIYWKILPDFVAFENHRIIERTFSWNFQYEED